MRSAKLRGMLLLKILAMLLISILMAGCLQMGKTSPQLPPKPTKPEIQTEAHPTCDRGICLDGDNTYLLLDYIWRLEEGYKQ